MKRIKGSLLILLCITSLSLGACQAQTKTTAKSASQLSTKIKSNRLSSETLIKDFNRICNSVISPVRMINLGTAKTALQQNVKKQQKILENLQLRLQNNLSTPTTTQALLKYITLCQKVLTDIQTNNGKSFTADTKTFSNQTANIAKQYFQDQTPQSMIDYAKQTKTSSSSAK